MAKKNNPGCACCGCTGFTGCTVPNQITLEFLTATYPQASTVSCEDSLGYAKTCEESLPLIGIEYVLSSVPPGTGNSILPFVATCMWQLYVTGPCELYRWRLVAIIDTSEFWTVRVSQELDDGAGNWTELLGYTTTWTSSSAADCTNPLSAFNDPPFPGAGTCFNSIPGSEVQLSW